MATTTTQRTKDVIVKTTNSGSAGNVQNFKSLHDNAETQARANAQSTIKGWHEVILPVDPTNPSITAHFLIALY